MSYKDLLKQRSVDIKPPKPIPSGPYVAQIRNYEFTTRGEKRTECVAFNLTLLEAGDEVDQEELANAAEEVKRAKPQIRKFLTPDSIFILNKFLLETLGIEQGEKSLEEMLAESINKKVVLVYQQQPAKDDPTRTVSFFDDRTGILPFTG